jgi:hypothetical protein
VVVVPAVDNISSVEQKLAPVPDSALLPST